MLLNATRLIFILMYEILIKHFYKIVHGWITKLYFLSIILIILDFYKAKRIDWQWQDFLQDGLLLWISGNSIYQFNFFFRLIRPSDSQKAEKAAKKSRRRRQWLDHTYFKKFLNFKFYWLWNQNQTKPTNINSNKMIRHEWKLNPHW